MNYSDTTQKVICPYCHGDKVVDVGWEFHGHSRGSHRITETCPVCKGEGIAIWQTIYKPIYKPVSEISNKETPSEWTYTTKTLLDISEKLKNASEKLRHMAQKDGNKHDI